MLATYEYSLQSHKPAHWTEKCGKHLGLAWLAQPGWRDTRRAKTAQQESQIGTIDGSNEYQHGDAITQFEHVRGGAPYKSIQSPYSR